MTKPVIDELYLKPLLKCPKCGAPMRASFSKGRNMKYPYYHCNECGTRFNTNKVNDSLIKFINRIKPHPAVVKLYGEVLNDIHAEERRKANSRQSELEDKITKIENRLAMLQDKWLDGAMENEEYMSIKERLCAEIHSLKSNMELHKTPSRSEFEPKLDYAISLINRIGDLCKILDADTRLKVVGSNFDGKIECSDEIGRTAKLNSVVSLITSKPSSYRDKKENEDTDFSESSLRYPEPGSNRHILSDIGV